MAAVGEVRTCGCRGIRRCLICQSDAATNVSISEKDIYQCCNCGRLMDNGMEYEIFSPPLRKCRNEQNCQKQHHLVVPDHVTISTQSDETVSFGGVTVVKEFVTFKEEESLINQLDMSLWAESQSGRRKQDYGPKVNFKKSKVRLASFNGLPSYSEHLVQKLAQVTSPLLTDFTPVELCNLDYDPVRGSAIDPHTDDTWLWGERLITINLLSHTYLSFTYPHCSVTVHVPLPRLSVVIVTGMARHVWHHSIDRRNIIGRRVAITMRELGGEFLPGKKDEEMGRQLIETAKQFCGTPVNFSLK